MVGRKRARKIYVLSGQRQLDDYPSINPENLSLDSASSDLIFSLNEMIEDGCSRLA